MAHTPTVTVYVKKGPSDFKIFDPAVLDRKGRKVETSIQITECSCRLVREEGDYGHFFTYFVPEALRARVLAGETVTVYEVRSSALRDGEIYGAFAKGTQFASRDQAEKAREKSGAAAIKRNRKQFGSV